MSQPPPVGQRPELPEEEIERILERRRFPEHDTILGDGRYLQCIARERASGNLYYRNAKSPVLSVHVGRQKTPHGSLQCVTLSYPNHLPSWKDLRLVREHFFDPEEVDVMILLPRKSRYFNEHPYMIWLWETPQPWGWPAIAPREELRRMGIPLSNDQGGST